MIIFLSILVIILALVDNFKYFLLSKSNGKGSKANIRKFLTISIITRVAILIYSIIRFDWTFIIVYAIGTIAVATAYNKRKHHTLEVK